MQTVSIVVPQHCSVWQILLTRSHPLHLVKLYLNFFVQINTNFCSTDIFSLEAIFVLFVPPVLLMSCPWSSCVSEGHEVIKNWFFVRYSVVSPLFVDTYEKVLLLAFPSICDSSGVHSSSSSLFLIYETNGHHTSHCCWNEEYITESPNFNIIPYFISSMRLLFYTPLIPL